MTSTPVIKCDSVYKIFGANAEKMLQNSNGNVDAKIFQDEMYKYATTVKSILIKATL